MDTTSSHPPRPFKLTPTGGLKIVRGGGALVTADDTADASFWEKAGMIFFGAAFAFVGAVIVFGRKWIAIDPRGVVSIVYGAIVPIRQRDEELAVFGKVAVDFVRGDSDSEDCYEVALKRKTGGDGLVLYSSKRYSDVQERAAYLAAFLKRDLLDNTSEHKSVLRPDELEHPLRGRLARHDDVVKYACPPLGMKSAVTDDGMTLRIELPPPGFSFMSIVSLAIPVAVAWYLLEAFIPFFDRSDMPEYVADFFTGFVIFFFFALPVAMFIKSTVRSFRRTAVIEIGSDHCDVTTFAAFSRKTVRVPVADIVDLDYGTAAGATAAMLAAAEDKMDEKGGSAYDNRMRTGGVAKFATFLTRLTRSKGIVIKTRRDIITVGEGLSDEETVYLFAVMAGRLSTTAGV
ncbi:MAG: hypothetical protein A4E73_01878 [Syntrophaceae bacterium PtaU1.Bin231]|nr:MAG: hypothetical protein A4E73_01878 [Syntrophaceae bacterium PtaU1.Bin231]